MCFGRIDDDRFFTREIQELEDFNAKTEADDEYQKKFDTMAHHNSHPEISHESLVEVDSAKLNCTSILGHH